MHSILIINRVNRSHWENEKNFTDGKSDVIPFVIIFLCLKLFANRIINASMNGDIITHTYKKTLEHLHRQDYI